MVQDFINMFYCFSLHFFGQLRANHQDKTPYICDNWYLSLYIDDCLVCRAVFLPAYQTVIYGTVFSPDDGHIVAQNMQRKATNMFKKFVDQIGSIYKRPHMICFKLRKSNNVTTLK